jgi:hypothetical protein
VAVEVAVAAVAAESEVAGVAGVVAAAAHAGDGAAYAKFHDLTDQPPAQSGVRKLLRPLIVLHPIRIRETAFGRSFAVHIPIDSTRARGVGWEVVFSGGTHTVRVYSAIVQIEDDGSLAIVDMIKYQGDLWLVPEWLPVCTMIAVSGMILIYGLAWEWSPKSVAWYS